MALGAKPATTAARPRASRAARRTLPVMLLKNPVIRVLLGSPPIPPQPAARETFVGRHSYGHVAVAPVSGRAGVPPLGLRCSSPGRPTGFRRGQHWHGHL